MLRCSVVLLVVAAAAVLSAAEQSGQQRQCLWHAIANGSASSNWIEYAGEADLTGGDRTGGALDASLTLRTSGGAANSDARATLLDWRVEDRSLILAGDFSATSGPLDTLHNLLADHREFYSCETAEPLFVMTTVTALMANTNFDGSFDRHYDSLRVPSTNGFVKTVKSFGNGAYTLPIYGGAMALHWLLPADSHLAPVGDWGERTMRAFVVGAPPMLLMQLATGGSRPEEGKSHWHPFADDNGASGHAFMGALPFLTAAHMTGNRILKSGLYVASGLTGWSRINDRDHYLSQVVLGWSMAWLATRAVARVDDDGLVQLLPIATPEYSGVLVSLRF
ncbi:MAG: phosphatase PAP2 family protein [Planctomycetaceae bacterium]|nr:phosphatase PAP2 family protein [Planctomycetaceae bacterium]